MWFDQYAGHYIVSIFWLHSDSHSQSLTASETPSVLTLARPNLICLLFLDWLSWLLLLAASALSCHLLADHRVSLHITVLDSRIGVATVEIMSSSFLLSVLICRSASYTHDTCYFFNQDSQQRYIYTAYILLACVTFTTILFFQIIATCQATTWLVVTRTVACHPSSVLSQAFHLSNFAILAIYPHTLDGCVLWSRSETELCFRVHPLPLASS